MTEVNGFLYEGEPHVLWEDAPYPFDVSSSTSVLSLLVLLSPSFVVPVLPIFPHRLSSLLLRSFLSFLKLSSFSSSLLYSHFSTSAFLHPLCVWDQTTLTSHDWNLLSSGSPSETPPPWWGSMLNKVGGWGGKRLTPNTTIHVPRIC